MKTKESWIEDTLQSLDGIKRASPDAGLFLRIRQGLALPGRKVVPLRRPFYWTAAAGIAILITLNILGALYYSQAVSLSQKAPAAIATDYLSYLGPIKL